MCEVLVSGSGMALHTILAAAERPSAAAVGDRTELLVVLVQKAARVAGDMPDRGCRDPVGVAQPPDASPRGPPVHGRRRQPEERTQAIGSVPPLGSCGQNLRLPGGAQASR